MGGGERERKHCTDFSALQHDFFIINIYKVRNNEEQLRGVYSCPTQTRTIISSTV